MSGPSLAERVHRRALALDGPSWVDADQAERRRVLAGLVRTEAPLLPDPEVEPTVTRVLARMRGMGPLEPLLADESVTEVMVNGGGAVWLERGGAIEATELVLEEDVVLQLIERVVGPLGLRVDRANPLVDARLPDGSRVHAIVRPVAIDGPCLTIRRFGVRRFALTSFAGPGIVDLLRWAVAARLNLLVSGGTGSGKTTLLNTLASLIPPAHRVVSIEDTAELRLPCPHLVRLEARAANAEGVGELGIRELVRTALRMRPDRILVGEVRGGEALDMLQAMNTGHEGSMSTCHANTPADALRRIETMILMGRTDIPLVAIREQVAASIDLVVQVARGADGTRAITAVHEVVRAHPDARHVPDAATPPHRGIDRSTLVARSRASTAGPGRGSLDAAAPPAAPEAAVGTPAASGAAGGAAASSEPRPGTAVDARLRATNVARSTPRCGGVAASGTGPASG